MCNFDGRKNLTVAVLGGGAVGKAVAADCVLGGNKVRICDLESFASETLANVDKTGITLIGKEKNKYGFKRTGTAHFDLITSDVAECVKGAKLIIVAVPSIGQSLSLKN